MRREQSARPVQGPGWAPPAMSWLWTRTGCAPCPALPAPGLGVTGFAAEHSLHMAGIIDEEGLGAPCPHQSAPSPLPCGGRPGTGAPPLGEALNQEGVACRPPCKDSSSPTGGARQLSPAQMHRRLAAGSQAPVRCSRRRWVGGGARASSPAPRSCPCSGMSPGCGCAGPSDRTPPCEGSGGPAPGNPSVLQSVLTGDSLPVNV